MTDLVAQLVGALDRLTLAVDVAEDGCTHGGFGPGYENGHGIECGTLIQAARTEARAALSAAKDGGWLPIETAPRGSGIDGPDSVTHPDYVDPPKLLLWTEEGPLVGYYDWYYHPGYGRGAEDGESAWRDHGGARTYGATAWQPLPNPPKEQNT